MTEECDSKRVVISEEELASMDKEGLLKLWLKQEKYIAVWEQKHNSEVKELESKLQMALHEVSRKEDLMMMRLTAKEQELQDYISQISEMKASGANSAVRTLLLDPAVNFVIEKLKRELSDTKAKLEETQSELSAWKFTPDSQTGKRLMAKCRLLHQENEDLGKVVSSGKLAKLETELALQRNLADEMKKSQSEMDEFVQELDEDVEGMQSTILYLQQQLRQAKEAQATSAPVLSPDTNGLSPPPADDPAEDADDEAAPDAEPEEPATAPAVVETEAADAEPASGQNGHAERELPPPAAVAAVRTVEPAVDGEAAPAPEEPPPPPESPEPAAGGRRRRRRPTEPEPTRGKRRAAAAATEDSPARRAKRTRSTEDNGVAAAAD